MATKRFPEPAGTAVHVTPKSSDFTISPDIATAKTLLPSPLQVISVQLLGFGAPVSDQVTPKSLDFQMLPFRSTA